MSSNYEIYKEIKADFDKENKTKREWIKKHGKYRIFLFWIILFLLFLPSIVLFFTKKTYEYVPDLDNLPEPIQTPTSWWTTMNVKWTDVQIDFLAKYDISWKIISIRDYAWTDIEKGLWPRDFVIWRWKMWRQEIIDKFNRNDMKNRIIYAYVPYENTDRFNKEFDADVQHGNRWTCMTSYSNNHPIPANKRIRLLMKKIKEWDVVRLQWYLVYARRTSKNRDYRRWPSSLVRTDTWNWACEIIYVTDITRLKEK